MTGHYNSHGEIAAVVDGFETCTTAKESFSHQSHLTVAVWYLHSSNLNRATESMRAGLQKFLDHHGIAQGKYHETLTVFWLQLIQGFLDQLSSDCSLVEKTNLVVERFADPRVVFDYYTREVVMSDEARAAWVEPDLISDRRSRI